MFFDTRVPTKFYGDYIKGDSVYRDNDSLRYVQLKDADERYAPIGSGAVDSTLSIQVKYAESITKGQAVYVSGGSGTNIEVSKASNTTEATSSKTLGLAIESGATNHIARIITDGILNGLNTSSATIGDPVWLGTSGNLVYGLVNKPIAPAHLVYMGVVTRAHATQGEIFVKIQNGFELNEIHDVLLTSLANNQVLTYESASGLWKNKLVDLTSINLDNGKIPVGDGTGKAFGRTPSGDVTMDNLGAFTITNNAVTSAKIADANVTNAKLANSTISGVSLGNNLNDLTIGSGLSLNSGTTYNGGTARTLTNNLLTGVSGGQTLIGSTSTNSGINIRATSGVGTTGSNIAFQVGNNGATTAMTILPSGFVGIGTASPSNSLVVATGSGQYTSAFSILPSTHASSRRTSLTLDDWIILQDLGGNGTKDFSLYQITSLTSRFYISNTGNIGINTNTPSERLSVSGNATVSGALSVGGNATVSGALSVGGNATVTGTLTSNNSFTMLAGVNLGYLYTASNLTLTSAHAFVVSDAPITITLPSVAGIAGRMYVIGNTSGGNTITISSSSQFTNVAGTPTSITLAAQTGKSVMVLATGGGWVVVSQ